MTRLTRKEEALYKFNIICIYIMLTWANLAVLVFKFDRVGRFLTATVVLCFLINLFYNRNWRICFKISPILIWTIWIIYATLNVTVQGHRTYWTTNGIVEWHEDQFYIQDILKQLVVMVCVAWMYLKDPQRLLKHLVIIFMTIAVATILFDSVNKSWGDTGRFGTVMGNTASLTMVVLAFILSICWYRKYIKPRYIYMSFIIAIGLMLAIQTRKALVAFCIISIFTYLTKYDIRKPSNWIAIIIFMILIAGIGEFVLDNTAIGERFATTKDDGENVNELGIPALDWLGDRAFHVYLGWNIFLEHPLCGVGLENTQYYTNLPYPLHQEYIGQLAENGIIGFSLLILFYINIIKGVTKRFADYHSYGICLICIGGILAILFISFTAWTWQHGYFFVLFGILAVESRINHTVKKSRLEK